MKPSCINATADTVEFYPCNGQRKACISYRMERVPGRESIELVNQTKPIGERDEIVDCSWLFAKCPCSL